ncbi:calcium-binding protein [Herbaspirillum sp. BH-1]|uniref:calcium-binding protein n=1 Tax=Herbaspirillum sp. (strain BH-1) TaxID=2058884 RepID=UPI0026F43EA6|nr:calcium-binding protein [Herbaspirillum sp. BH-1]
MTTAMLGAVGAVGTDWASQQRQAALLEAQNAVYARINNGVGTYMTLYYPRIIDRSTYPDSCAKVNHPASASPDKACQFAASYTDAAGASKTHQVANILQPTLADLQTLGLVDRQIPAAPLLPVRATVATVATGGATGSAAATIDGGDGNDGLSGDAGNDTLIGGNGDDNLYGGDGDDTLSGGKGNDYLNGGLGNDIYIFNKGDGVDTISDYDYNAGNIDTLRLGKGINAPDTVVARSGNHLILTWDTDTITIENFFLSGYYHIEKIAFDDGTTWTYSDLASRLTQTGTSENEYWIGLSDASNRMAGMAGDDSLIGRQLADTIDGGDGNDGLSGDAGNDTLIGGNGDDNLYGGDGDDTLSGGKGNDYLNGGLGNDIYAFNKGDGVDTISDYDYNGANIDSLKFGAGITSKRLSFSHVGNNLEISVSGTGGKTIIENWYLGSAYQVERISTADNVTILNTDLERLIQPVSSVSTLSFSTAVLAA